jgi:hypothetical protein
MTEVSGIPKSLKITLLQRRGRAGPRQPRQPLAPARDVDGVKRHCDEFASQHADGQAANMPASIAGTAPIRSRAAWSVRER